MHAMEKTTRQEAGLERENRRLGEEIRRLTEENRRLGEENRSLKQRVSTLEAVVGQRREAKESKPPKFTGDYSLEGQEKQRSRKRRKQSPGRRPKADKRRLVARTEDVYPEGASKENCTFHRDRLAWRLIDGRAVLVCYRLHRERGTSRVATLPDVLPRGEFGLEIAATLAYLVYGMNLSIDQGRELLRFFHHLELSGSQANLLLDHLARLWEAEFETLLDLLVLAMVIFIDETGWQVSARRCYAWVFKTLMHTVLLFGRDRSASVLDEILPRELFRGIAVTDDYAAYRQRFCGAQKCWAHLLRKAIKLMLTHPEEACYREFLEELLGLFRAGKQIQKDKRLSAQGRARKRRELEDRFEALGFCYRADEARRSAPGGEDFARLLNELVRCHAEDALFTFVTHPEVPPTNNDSERSLRGTAQSRNTGRTSKTDSGAKRRSVICSVLASLAQNLPGMTLESLLGEVTRWCREGESLFRRQLRELQESRPPPPLPSETPLPV
jgi:transposase